MKSIAFIFSHAPHGNCIGREGLDFLLATSLTIQNIAVFFIGDGVFQIIKNQKPEKVLLKNYTSAFRILSLYGINQYYFCADSLKERGFVNADMFLLDTLVLDNISLRNKLKQFEGIINF
ncbi:MAG TPA: sulfurtransferase complex subunit TusC [Buchnera sp. (in: enterobacteria)]|nr:sulfurtransferase complex subunit TusC [Buchnera sp. (in: enterobacteria)]